MCVLGTDVVDVLRFGRHLAVDLHARCTRVLVGDVVELAVHRVRRIGQGVLQILVEVARLPLRVALHVRHVSAGVRVVVRVHPTRTLDPVVSVGLQRNIRLLGKRGHFAGIQIIALVHSDRLSHLRAMTLIKRGPIRRAISTPGPISRVTSSIGCVIGSLGPISGGVCRVFGALSIISGSLCSLSSLLCTGRLEAYS